MLPLRAQADIASSLKAEKQRQYHSFLTPFLVLVHSKCFEVCVVVGEQRFPRAWGPTKKQAEQEAAKRALRVLRDNASN